MTKPNAKYYFRDKRLAPRQKFTQKYLRPLAAWIERHSPEQFIANGVVWVGLSFLMPWFVISFFNFTMALPWIFMAIFLGLAVTSWALRRGRHGSSD
jgi:hypothetical protein